MPLVAVNLSLLPTGEILVNEGEIYGWITMTWDPILNEINWEPLAVADNIFCNGVEQLGNGRIIIVGGQTGDTNHVLHSTHIRFVELLPSQGAISQFPAGTGRQR